MRAHSWLGRSRSTRLVMAADHPTTSLNYPTTRSLVPKCPFREFLREFSTGTPEGQLRHGQAKFEPGPLADLGRVGGQQLPALGVGQLAGDVEAEADPAGLSGGPRV